MKQNLRPLTGEEKCQTDSGLEKNRLCVHAAFGYNCACAVCGMMCCYLWALVKVNFVAILFSYVYAG